MSVLIDNFKKLYPSLSVTDINGDCVIAEVEDKTNKNCLRQLIFSDVVGWQFPHEMPKKASSFFKISQKGVKVDNCNCLSVVREDCDGVFCVESNNKLILYVCELKTSFIKENICKAKDQIVGSFVKMLGLLNMLQGFCCENVEMRGLIISYEPDRERLSSFKMENRQDYFCLNLYNHGNYSMPKNNCELFWHPLAFRHDIHFVYISVPKGLKSYKISFDEIESKLKP